MSTILGSSTYANDTLILVTYDEKRGLLRPRDAAPPSTVDGEVYGANPLLAIGTSRAEHGLARRDGALVGHPLRRVQLARGHAGQLSTRDAVVNNIGSLLDPTKTGATVP